MKYTFIHAADIHLDSPLRGLGAYSESLSECFRSASRQAFVRLVDAAIERGVAFVVIAGDIYDGDWKDYNTGLFFVKQMGRLDRANIPVYAISGNHDAETEITRNLPYPDNVKFFNTKKPETIEDEKTGAVLHGQGFHNRWSDENIALEYPKAVTGTFNIGLLHTACEGSAEHATYAPCTIEQLCNHGYDYWALGHVHGHAVLSDDPYVVFSGNLQGRHVRETGAKGFCLIEVTDNTITDFQHVPCDVARWSDLTINMEADCAEMDTLLKLLRDQAVGAVSQAHQMPLAVRLTLAGATNLHWELINNEADLRAQVEAVFLSVGDDLMLEKLRVKTSPPQTAAAVDPDHQDLIAELIGEMDDPRMLEALEAEMARQLTTMQTKLPGKETVIPDAEELKEIIEEAKSLVVGKLAHSGADTSED